MNNSDYTRNHVSATGQCHACVDAKFEARIRGLVIRTLSRIQEPESYQGSLTLRWQVNDGAAQGCVG